MYTKGEWRIIHPKPTVPWEEAYLVVANTTRIAVVPVFGSSRPRTEVEANAHLIKAAPLMYEACILALDETPGKPLGEDVKQVIRQALAKVEGKESK